MWHKIIMTFAHDNFRLVDSHGFVNCFYFSAKNAEILQPAQKVFITWDPPW